MSNRILWRTMLLVGIFAAPALAREPQSDIVMHWDQPIGPPIVGFGAQMNPYLYASPNWGNVTEENVKDYEAKVVALRPQFVRMFMVPAWMHGEPDGINKHGEPRMRDSFLRSLRLAQRGATITLTTWYGEPSDPEKTARLTAETLLELLDKEHIDAIKSINMMNEPDMDWPGEENWTLPAYNRLVRALDSELKRLNLRQRLHIITGDMVEDYQPAWMANIAENLAEISDGISIHAYWKYDDTGFMLGRLNDTVRMTTTRPSIRSKPLYATEFGSQGITDGNSKHEPWLDRSGKPMAQTTTQPMQIGWFMMEAINRGFSGTVQWDMCDVAYERLMHYGVIGEPKLGWPLRPAYFVLKMFTHTTGVGWRAVKIDGAIHDGLTCAMIGPHGERTVYLLNRNERAASVRIGGMKPTAQLHAITWNANGDGKLSAAKKLADGEGLISVEMPPLSITALTDRDVAP